MFITIKKNFIIKLILVILISIIVLLFILFCTYLKPTSNSPTISSNEKTDLSISNLNNNTNNNIIKNKTIILDAGHGLPDGGATSNLDSNIIESDLNLQVVLKLEKLLTSSNINVILTRSDENGIYNESADTIRKKKISDMENRVNISNTSEADLFISIHMNKLNNSNVKGFQVFYSDTTSPFKAENISKKCANFIDQNLKNIINETNTSKSVKEISNIYLTNHLKIPLVLIECGFLSNIDDTKLLTTEKYQEKLAFGIYTGIMDYLNSY